MSTPNIDVLVAEAVAALSMPESTKGEKVRNALQIVVLLFIDEEKSYPRGGYVTHSGALWCTREVTHGMRGRGCLVYGILVIDVRGTDEWNFTVTMRLHLSETSKSVYEKSDSIDMLNVFPYNAITIHIYSK